MAAGLQQAIEGERARAEGLTAEVEVNDRCGGGGQGSGGHGRRRVRSNSLRPRLPSNRPGRPSGLVPTVPTPNGPRARADKDEQPRSPRARANAAEARVEKAEQVQAALREQIEAMRAEAVTLRATLAKPRLKGRKLTGWRRTGGREGQDRSCSGGIWPSREAQEAEKAARVRETEDAARRQRGVLARLRAAWRGE